MGPEYDDQAIINSNFITQSLKIDILFQMKTWKVQKLNIFSWDCLQM